MQEGLEGLSLLLAGEGVGRQHRRHHQGHDEEEGCQQVAVDEHDELLVGGKLQDRAGQVPGHRAEDPVEVGVRRASRRQPDDEGQEDHEESRYRQHRDDDGLGAAHRDEILGDDRPHHRPPHVDATIGALSTSLEGGPTDRLSAAAMRASTAK